MFKVRKRLVTLLSLSLVLSSCSSFNNGDAFVINEATVEKAVALTSKVLSNEGDLFVEIQGEGVTFNNDITDSQALVRDLSKTLPEEETTDIYITYDQLKSLCADKYSIYTSSNSKSLYIDIPDVPANSAYSLVLSPRASSLGQIGYASFSNTYSEETASDLQVKALNLNKVNGYFNEWNFVYSYQNGLLADSFSANDVILTGAFENCHVFSLTHDDSHIEVRIRGFVNYESMVGYVGFISNAFNDNDISFVFPYQIEYPTAVMLNYTYEVDIENKEASFEIAFYDTEVPSEVLPSDINIEGIVCKKAIPNLNDNTIKLVLDTGEYVSEASFTEALEEAVVSFSFFDLLTIDINYFAPQIEANAYVVGDKTYLEFFPLEKGVLNIDTNNLSECLYIPSNAEEPFFDLSKAEITRNLAGNGYVLSWDGLSNENQGQLMILYGSLMVDSYEIPLIGDYSYFSFVNYYVDANDNELLRKYVFTRSVQKVDDGNIAQFDSEVTSAAKSAGTILGIVSAVLGGVIGILGGVFGVKGAGKMVAVGILGLASFGLSMSAMLVGMDEMDEGIKMLSEAIQFVSGNVVEIRRDLMALNYKIDTLLVKERMNHDRQMYEMYRDRLSNFQNRFEKPIYDLQSEFGDLTNTYMSSLFKGNTTGDFVFGNTVPLKYTTNVQYNASGLSYFDEKHNELLVEDTELIKSFDATFNDQTELFSDTYNLFKKSMQINDAVKIKAINAIEEGLNNGSVVLSGSDVPEINDENIEELAEDIYQACILRSEYLALSRPDKVDKYEKYLTAADDYFMRFSGTGVYEGEAAASYMYKMFTLEYNFQNEVKDKIHQIHSQYGIKLLQMYTNVLMIHKFNDLTFNVGRVLNSYKAASDYLDANTWIQKYEGDMSQFPQGENTLIDFCYVTNTFIRIGTIETRFDINSDLKNFKINGTYAYEVNLSEPKFKPEKKQTYTKSLAQLSPYLVNAENFRVILERKKMISTESNYGYILKNKYLFDWDQYEKDVRQGVEYNLGYLIMSIFHDGKRYNILEPRFIYSFEGAEKINSGDPIGTGFKCKPTFYYDSRSDYFKYSELTDAYGKGTRGKAESQYWDGWCIRGDVGTLDALTHSAPSNYINRLAHYDERHGYWRVDEMWVFEEYYRGDHSSNENSFASVMFDLAMIMVF